MVQRRLIHPVARRRARVAAAVWFAAVCASVLAATPAFGEGSAEFNAGADSTTRVGLLGWSNTNAPYWHSYSVLRVYSRGGETIQMGSSAMGLGGSSNILVYAPGTDFADANDATARAPYPSDPVFATDVRDCNADAPGTARIGSRCPAIRRPAIRSRPATTTSTRYKGTTLTNASPSAVTNGTSGPGFHAWTGSTGHTDFIDTWAPVRALPGASGRKINRATGSSSAATTARATRTIRVLAARVLGGGVTG